MAVTLLRFLRPQPSTPHHSLLRPPTESDLPRLPYTEAVLNEAMRLFPPAHATTRIVEAGAPLQVSAQQGGAGLRCKALQGPVAYTVPTAVCPFCHRSPLVVPLAPHCIYPFEDTIIRAACGVTAALCLPARTAVAAGRRVSAAAHPPHPGHLLGPPRPSRVAPTRRLHPGAISARECKHTHTHTHTRGSRPFGN